MKINLITHPDIIYDEESLNISLMFLRNEFKKDIQEILLNMESQDKDINVYIVDNTKDYNWIFSTFQQCDYVVLDVDSTPPWFRDIMGFFVSKKKTFWLTNADSSVYNYISSNRVYDFSFLKNIGDSIEKQ
jgi:hypothetical protein